MEQRVDHPLTKFRAEAELSRAELARLAETTRQTIHRIESGEQTPSLALVRRILRVARGRGITLSADAFLTDSEAA